MFYYYAAYLLVMSLWDMILMICDKSLAVRRKRRISEKTLLTVAALGGAFGGFLAMYLVRHKTKHWYFVLLMPMLSAVYLILGVYLYAKK